MPRKSRDLPARILDALTSGPDTGEGKPQAQDSNLRTLEPQPLEPPPSRQEWSLSVVLWLVSGDLALSNADQSANRCSYRGTPAPRGDADAQPHAAGRECVDVR